MTESYKQDRSTPEVGLTSTAAKTRAITRMMMPTIQWLAAQHRATLRQNLGPDSHEAIMRLETATRQIEESISRRLEDRLMVLLSEEIREIYEQALQKKSTEAVDSRAPYNDTSEKEGLGHIEKSDRFGIPGTRLQRRLDVRHSDVHKAVPDQSVKRRTASGVNEANRTGYWKPPEINQPRNMPVAVIDPQRPTLIKHPSGLVTSERYMPSLPIQDTDKQNLYKGNVMLTIKAEKGIGQVVQFVRDLCRAPDIRLRTMTSDHTGKVRIQLSLRQPMNLIRVIPEIEGVSRLNDSGEDQEPENRVIDIELMASNSSIEATQRDPVAPEPAELVAT